MFFAVTDMDELLKVSQFAVIDRMLKTGNFPLQNWEASTVPAQMPF